MNFKKINITGNWAKLPLLLLYISFFTVQLFFNFDIANHSINSPQLYSYKELSATRIAPVVVNKTNKGKTKQQTIRLNKRFEPQAILVHHGMEVKGPVYCSNIKLPGIRKKMILSSPYLYSQSFRGPPVAA
jgi:hypothetical protein